MNLFAANLNTNDENSFTDGGLGLLSPSTTTEYMLYFYMTWLKSDPVNGYPSDANASAIYDAAIGALKIEVADVADPNDTLVIDWDTDGTPIMDTVCATSNCADVSVTADATDNAFTHIEYSGADASKMCTTTAIVDATKDIICYKV